jgi:hypothetical protein
VSEKCGTRDNRVPVQEYTRTKYKAPMDYWYVGYWRDLTRRIVWSESMSYYSRDRAECRSTHKTPIYVAHERRFFIDDDFFVLYGIRSEILSCFAPAALVTVSSHVRRRPMAACRSFTPAAFS